MIAEARRSSTETLLAHVRCAFDPDVSNVALRQEIAINFVDSLNT